MTPGPAEQESSRPVVLVTGSARGIGLGVARELSGRGWRTHVVWRSSQDPELEDRFPGRAHRADLTRPDDVRGLVRGVLDRDGRLDGVVHAVGEYVAGPLEGLPHDELVRMFESNVFSSFLVAEGTRAALRETRGAWVFFGCAGVERLGARRDAAGYVAAKTALVSFVRSLALEEAPWGVRANLVSPGLVPHPHASDDTHELAGRVPLGRPGTENDLAAAAAWLLSAEAGHVTGQNLDVAGGWFL